MVSRSIGPVGDLKHNGSGSAYFHATEEGEDGEIGGVAQMGLGVQGMDGAGGIEETDAFVY